MASTAPGPRHPRVGGEGHGLGVSFGDRAPLALSWRGCWPLKGLLCPRWSPPPAPPVPRDLAQQTEAPGAEGPPSPPAYHTVPNCIEHVRVRVHTAPDPHAHARRPAEQGGWSELQAATAPAVLATTPGETVVRYRSILIHSMLVEQDFYILLSMNKANWEAHVCDIGHCRRRLRISRGSPCEAFRFFLGSFPSWWIELNFKKCNGRR